MILLDSSALVASLAGSQVEKPTLANLVARGERLLVPALVLYEFWRGPRTDREIDRLEELLPADEALAFGPDEAAVAARLYRTLARARQREVDLAIAAHALVSGATLWTLNYRDFTDIPDLRMHTP